MTTISDPVTLAAAMPFAAACGVTIEQADPGEVVGTMRWTAERCTVAGVLHGGALMTLADSVGAVCAYLNLPAGTTATATIDSTTAFLRGVRGGSVAATARPLHVGRTVMVIRTELHDADGRLVAHTVASQAVRPG
jgi:1,4-dihydroxy-2-naphthoyl-CoA hydrolase